MIVPRSWVRNGVNTVQRFNLKLISSVGASFNNVFLIIKNINTSINGDNKTSRLKGYHHAAARAHKTKGILVFVIKEETNHRILVVQKKFKTCRLVNLTISNHFSFVFGGYLNTIQSGTKRVSYPCFRKATLILLSSEMIELPPCPFICDIRFASSNTAFGMASPPPHRYPFFPPRNKLELRIHEA